jgi:hypothetical protein
MVTLGETGCAGKLRKFFLDIGSPRFFGCTSTGKTESRQPSCAKSCKGSVKLDPQKIEQATIVLEDCEAGLKEEE